MSSASAEQEGSPASSLLAVALRRAATIGFMRAAKSAYGLVDTSGAADGCEPSVDDGWSASVWIMAASRTAAGNSLWAMRAGKKWTMAAGPNCAPWRTMASIDPKLCVSAEYTL